MPRISTAAGVLAVLATSAMAQEHPPFLPTRDVAVTYQLTSGQGGPSQTTHMYYSAAVNKLRIDTPNNAGYTVLDRGAGQRLMVMNQERSFASVPVEPGMADGFILNTTMSYRRQGESSVAGLPCTLWSVSSSQATGSACVTADGVLLRGSGHPANGQGADTGLAAIRVNYAPQPASLFEPPAGFRRMDPSELRGPPPGQGGPGQGGYGGPPPGQGGYGAPPPGQGYGGPNSGSGPETRNEQARCAWPFDRRHRSRPGGEPTGSRPHHPVARRAGDLSA